MEFERCDICDSETGRAGRLDDSIVCSICDRVICEDCVEFENENTIICNKCREVNNENTRRIR